VKLKSYRVTPTISHLLHK